MLNECKSQGRPKQAATTITERIRKSRRRRKNGRDEVGEDLNLLGIETGTQWTEEKEGT
jgi:hypothetical protein